MKHESSREQPIEVLGIWIGSPARLPPLAREGIFRFVFNLVQSLGQNQSLRFEVWCQHINLANVRELFAPLQGQEWFRQRVVFCTEFGDDGAVRPAGLLSHGARVTVFRLKELLSRDRRAAVFAAGLMLVGCGLLATWAGLGRLVIIAALVLLLLIAAVTLVSPVRALFEALATRLWEGFKRVSNVLPSAANRRSAAQVFLIQNLDLENCLRLNRAKVVCLHDLYTSEFAALFEDSARNRRLRFHGQRAARAAGQLARAGAVFVSNSDHIRRTHALALIRGLDERQTAVVLLPGPVPRNISAQLPPRESVLRQFGIASPYLFYPTHVRPYKNVLTLLKALSIVRLEGHDLRLVLTGRLSHDPACASLVETARLSDAVICTGELSELQMFALYRYATLVAVPTLSEGGFPWQALEAMAMEVPVIVSRIPVVLERLAYHGLSPETCGLHLFEPTDERALAQSMLEVMGRREATVAEQAPARTALASYSWDDVAAQYYGILNGAWRGSQHV